MTIPASMFLDMAREQQKDDPARHNRLTKLARAEALTYDTYPRGPLLDAFVDGMVTALYVQEIRERFTPEPSDVGAGRPLEGPTSSEVPGLHE